MLTEHSQVNANLNQRRVPIITNNAI